MNRVGNTYFYNSGLVGRRSRTEGKASSWSNLLATLTGNAHILGYFRWFWA